MINGLALFAGVGGLERALNLVFGTRYRTCCYVERDAYAASVLVARMEDKVMDKASVWDDVTTFDGRPWRGKVDLVSGGFPCQDISGAGKREGILKGKRSSLWFQFPRIIEETGASIAWIENVGALARRGLDIVLGSLADLGFDAEWLTLRASDVGAAHGRKRLFLLAIRGHRVDDAVRGRYIAPPEEVRAGRDTALPSGGGGSPELGYAGHGGCEDAEDDDEGGEISQSRFREVADAERPERGPDDVAGGHSGEGENSQGEAPGGLGERGQYLGGPEGDIIHALRRLGIEVSPCPDNDDPSRADLVPRWHAGDYCSNLEGLEELLRLATLADAEDPDRGSGVGGEEEGTGPDECGRGGSPGGGSVVADPASGGLGVLREPSGGPGQPDGGDKELGHSDDDGSKGSQLGGEEVHPPGRGPELAHADGEGLGKFGQPAGEQTLLGWPIQGGETSHRPPGDVSHGSGGKAVADADLGTRSGEPRVESGVFAPLPGESGRDLAHPVGQGHEGNGSAGAHGGSEPLPLRRDGSEIPLFAPGPGLRDLWTRILAHRPELAPSIKPRFRVVLDGVAVVVDKSRTDQLRCAGNGVVDLQAAVAFVVLDQRLGSRFVMRTGQEG